MNISQTILQALSAVGAVVAALVAWRALVYFKAQATAAAQTLTATREQMAAEQDRWEEARRREVRRDHIAVRPTVRIAQGSGVLAPNVVPLAAAFTGGEPVRSVRVVARMIGRDVAGECVPDGWSELRPDVVSGFEVRATAVQTGDRVEIDLEYVDALGATVRLTQPFVADATGGIFRLNIDPERSSVTADDLP